VETRVIGKNGPKVSVIGMGCNNFGGRLDLAGTREVVAKALDLGINFFDTADIYGGRTYNNYGGSEVDLGLALGGRRKDVVIATKFGMVFQGAGSGAKRAYVMSACEASLKRLKTDYIDVYQLHWPDRPMRIFEGLDYVHLEGDTHSIEDILGVLGEFVDAGKVRFVGLSNETPWGLMTFLKAAETLGLPRVVSIQNAYNLVNRSFETGLAEIFYREQVSLFAYSPLGQGYLTGKYEGGALPPGSRKMLFDRLGRYEMGNGPRAISAYVALARKHRLDPAQMALAFVTSRPFVTSNIIGATTLAQLKTDIDGCLLKLSDRVLKDIDGLHLTYPNPCP
jgi:aryl-alcohol dehydrogenase-like predicted oxidoreductase